MDMPPELAWLATAAWQAAVFGTTFGPMIVPHIPALRRGREYESLDKISVADHRTGEILAAVSQVNAGIVRKDLARLPESRAALKKLATSDLLAICARAGEVFLHGTLPLGEGTQTAQQYMESLSATSGLPHVLVRRNMKKIHDALTQMKAVLNGLTRGLDFAALDGTAAEGGRRLCFYPTTQGLGLVMPSNSPAVNSL